MATHMAIHRTDCTKHGLRLVLEILCRKNQVTTLPPELFDEIYYYMHPELFERLLANQAARRDMLETHPALTPPSNGECFFLGIDRYGRSLSNALPVELRKLIFMHILPSKEAVIKPVCGYGDPETRGKVTDLMTLNKQIKEEIKVYMYEERVFEIHVHEGLLGGGIEFLDAGRQPLHYLADDNDRRFVRFHADHEYGFGLLKKIKVVIFPNRTEGYQHMPFITHLAILSLARLLQRSSDEKSRIVSIAIEFAVAKTEPDAASGRLGIMGAEDPWWDFKKDEPKASSFHNLPDIELVLRPFGNLTNIHNVHIELPKYIHAHEPSIRFAEDLMAHMKSQSPFGLSASDDLENHTESMRFEAEDYIQRLKFGNKPAPGSILTEADWAEDDAKEVPDEGQVAEQDEGLSGDLADDDSPDDDLELLEQAWAREDGARAWDEFKENQIKAWNTFAQNATRQAGTSSNTGTAPPGTVNPADVEMSRADSPPRTSYPQPNPLHFQHGHPPPAPLPPTSPRRHIPAGFGSITTSRVHLGTSTPRRSASPRRRRLPQNELHRTRENYTLGGICQHCGGRLSMPYEMPHSCPPSSGTRSTSTNDVRAITSEESGSSALGTGRLSSMVLEEGRTEAGEPMDVSGGDYFSDEEAL